MQTNLPDSLLATPDGQDADRILRKCVHCGFCSATCPTYQVLGDELDSPRGRIYLMKDILEGAEITKQTQLHLDRCLTCQACETTCPSGVDYHHLLSIGRSKVAEAVKRPWKERLLRKLLLTVLPNRSLFSNLLHIGQTVRPVLPASLQQSIPLKQPESSPQALGTHARKVILFQGCVQPSLAPEINTATKVVLNKLGIESITINDEQCCGAVSHHLDDHEKARVSAKRNIDLWWPHIKSAENDDESSIEAIIITASGCSNFAKDYSELLKHDLFYAEKAQVVNSLIKDVGEYIAEQKAEVISLIQPKTQPVHKHIAFHSPCTLQHGQKLVGIVEGLLTHLGFNLLPITDPHLCCGSAGTYSILQKDLSLTLRERKLENLERENPILIATANIGCLTHLRSGTETPVRHWIEIVAENI